MGRRQGRDYWREEGRGYWSRGKEGPQEAEKVTGLLLVSGPPDAVCSG